MSEQNITIKEWTPPENYYFEIEGVDELKIQGQQESSQSFIRNETRKDFTIGSGDTSIRMNYRHGIWIGHEIFASAPFSVSMTGSVVASDITLTGATIKYGKTSFTDSTNSGYYIGSEGIYFGKAADATKMKFTISDGSLAVSGALTTGTGSTINGTYVDSIVANKITAGTGIINALSVLNTLTMGSASVSGTIQSYGYNGSANGFQIVGGSSPSVTVIGGTITGGTIQTATSGQRIRMTTSTPQKIEFLDGGTERGNITVGSDYVEINGPDDQGIKFGTFMGASAGGYINMPFIYGAGTSSVGQILLDGKNASAGLSWTGGADATFSFYLGTNLAKISSNIVPSSTYDLGTSASKWRHIYLSGDVFCGDGITLGGTRRTTWPTSGTTTLSGLSIDTAKSWGGYGISGLGTITPTSNISYNLGSSSYYWDMAYLRRIEFYSYSSNPSSLTYGQMWHHYESGGAKQFRGTPWNTDIYSFDMTAI